jgi:hypothetical protein
VADRRIGDQVPPLRIVPACDDTSGPEVIELAEAYGRKLDPWQKAVLLDAHGERRDPAGGASRWAAFQVLLMAVRQVGKGAGVLEPRALAGMHLFGERRIVWSANRIRTVVDALARMKAFYVGWDDLRKQVKRINESHTDMFIELYGRTAATRLTELRQIVFLTRTAHGARGLSGDCVIIDEAYSATRTMLGALVPILATLPDPQIWLTSTPPLDAIAEEARADPETAGGMPMFDLRQRALAGDDEIAVFDWAPEWTLDDVRQVERDRRRQGLPSIREDVDLWYRHCPAVGIRIPERQVRREAAAMSLRQFARERLGAWPRPPAEAAIDIRPIPEALWTACQDPNALDNPDAAPADVALAVEASPHRTHGAIALYGVRGDGAGQVEAVDHRPGTDWIPARLVELRDRHDPLVVVVSSRGPAASIIQRIKDMGIVEPEDRVEAARAEWLARNSRLAPGEADELRRPRRGDLLVTTLSEDADATAQFIDAVRAVGLWHLGDPELTSEVDGAALRDIGDGLQSWGRRSSKLPIPRLFGVTLARYGYYRRAGAVVEADEPYDASANVR